MTLFAGLAAAWTVASSGCAAAVPRPTPEILPVARARFPDTGLEELAEGRAHYVAKCAGCHPLHPVAKFPPERWREELAAMQTEAEVELTEAERRSIERYLVVMSAALRAPPGAGAAGADDDSRTAAAGSVSR
ncbi:MAG: hypothetical protein D6729_18560 [Deltaproteobacteria bacterium]|nr:MAG: hypothetical protein D6729_18560 [Deltaproteobacteria bacterium]